MNKIIAQITRRRETLRNRSGRKTRSHKFFLIKWSSMKGTWVKKGHPRSTSDMFELISIPNYPLKQVNSLVNSFGKKLKLLTRVRVSPFSPASITLKISHYSTQYRHWIIKLFKQPKYLLSNSCSCSGKWKITIFFFQKFLKIWGFSNFWTRRQ